MLSITKIISYHDESTRHLEEVEGSLYRQKGFRDFMIRFRGTTSTTNDDFIDLTSVRGQLEMSRLPRNEKTQPMPSSQVEHQVQPKLSILWVRV